MSPVAAQKRTFNIVMMLGMLVIILAGIRAGGDIVVPFILAVFIAVILNPLVSVLQRVGVPRVLAVSLLVGMIVLTGVLLLATLISMLNDFARTLPQYRTVMLPWLMELQEMAGLIGVAVSTEALVAMVDPNAAINLVSLLLSQISGTVSGIFLLLMTVVFMLLEVPLLTGKLQHLLRRPSDGMATIHQVLDNISRYLVLKTAISVMTGIVVWLMLLSLDVRFSLLWGALAFVLNYIPNIGSFLAAIPAILQVIIFQGMPAGMLVTAGYLMVNLLIGNMLEPRLMGRGLGLSTLVVFLSLIFWGWLFGPVGMLLSVPLTIVAKIVLEQAPGGAPLALLLSDAVASKG
ncbi:AI-2E family transporter [Erwinia psidii]|uniref:AI-2E family transporter n=1 Tax=Erwinia psidii TaxID=69224 RepID=A0A3N6SMP0_9GAMM|nr:AI-2E family transporter [Erwinia psidii]MCX8958698.1 AI-2E family transporter [Erwinia psidii]MCX8961173.1 AI-2E family transporter [Erwinia psidii]MCX8966655.1 AI-2E family transporter [Erwinia psidii]RQM38966.1 AI-2E family transporter [Erwinia psidii]